MLKNTFEILKYMESIANNNIVNYPSVIDTKRFLQDRTYAMVQFFKTWGLDRPKSTKGVKIADIKFLSLYAESLAKKDVATVNFNKYIKEYKEIAGTERLQEYNNSIMDKRLLSFDVQKTVLLLKENKIKEAYSSIKLRGVGAKIKSCFLRDMSILYKLEKPASIEEQLYMFPIDVWVRKFIGLLEIKPMKEYPVVEGGYGLSKDDLVLGFNTLNFCKNNNLDFRKVDSGIWFYCANVVGSMERLETLLKSDNVEILKTEYDIRFKVDKI